MKKLIISILCIGFIATFSSCEMGDGEMGKTRTGKQIFDGWGTDMNNLFSAILEPALQFNHYWEDPNVDIETLMTRNFSNSTLTETGERSYLIFHESSNSKLYLSMMSGDNLNDDGAIMRIYSIGRNLPSTIGGVMFFMENMGNGQWVLRNNNDLVITLDFGSEVLPSSLKNSKLSISGSGSFRHETHSDASTAVFSETLLSFDIFREMSVAQNAIRISAWPHQFYHDPVKWEGGSVELTAVNQSDGESNTAEATILESGKVSITIGGITQEWDQSCAFF